MTTSFPSFLPTVCRYISDETNIKYKTTNPKSCFLYNQLVQNLSCMPIVCQSSKFTKCSSVECGHVYISSFCLLGPYSLKYLLCITHSTWSIPWNEFIFVVYRGFPRCWTHLNRENQTGLHNNHFWTTGWGKIWKPHLINETLFYKQPRPILQGTNKYEVSFHIIYFLRGGK